MLLVILYHSCAFWNGGWFPAQKVEIEAEALGWFSLWLNSFHVYAFTLVSGYLFSYLKWERKKYKDFKPFIKNKAKRLLVPYLFTSIVWVIPIGQIFYHHSLLTLIKNYVLGIAPSQLWFLIMLFWCFIAAWIMSDVIQKRNMISIILAVGSFGIGYVCGIIMPNYFCIWTAFQFFPLFVLGMKLRDMEWLERIPVWMYIILDLILFVIWFLVQSNESIIMKLISAGVGFLLHIVGALMAWFVLQWIGSKINWKDQELFMAISNESMPMYLFHQQIIYILIFLLNGKINPYLHSGINFIAALVSSFLISLVLMQWSGTRFLIGEKG